MAGLGACTLYLRNCNMNAHHVIAYIYTPNSQNSRLFLGELMMIFILVINKKSVVKCVSKLGFNKVSINQMVRGN